MLFLVMRGDVYALVEQDVPNEKNKNEVFIETLKKEIGDIWDPTTQSEALSLNDFNFALNEYTGVLKESDRYLQKASHISLHGDSYKNSGLNGIGIGGDANGFAYGAQGYATGISGAQVSNLQIRANAAACSPDYSRYTGKPIPFNNVQGNPLAQAAVQEYVAWRNGTLKECQPGRRPFLTKYWNQSSFGSVPGCSAQPWSAAFISFIVPEFRAASHAQYINDAYNGKNSYTFYQKENKPIQVGDLTCATRAGGKFNPNGWYTSHCDLVVEANYERGYAIAVGGNVGNTVGAKRYCLHENATIRSSIINIGVLSTNGAANNTAAALPINGDINVAMGLKIIEFEAGKKSSRGFRASQSCLNVSDANYRHGSSCNKRRDVDGCLNIYYVPPGDAGIVEVAGVTKRYLKPQYEELANLVRQRKRFKLQGNEQQAQQLCQQIDHKAALAMVGYARKWNPTTKFGNQPANIRNNPGAQFVVYDSTFNNGQGGAAKIIRTMRPARTPEEFIKNFTQSRINYVRGRGKFVKALTDRANKAGAAGLQFMNAR